MRPESGLRQTLKGLVFAGGPFRSYNPRPRGVSLKVYLAYFVYSHGLTRYSVAIRRVASTNACPLSTTTGIGGDQSLQTLRNAMMATVKSNRGNNIADGDRQCLDETQL
ncbi:hypothetical protein B0A52_03614 [Exophiala mesophila]|uniref:Uncharacterized protein n=1 Tax=Exophiala mesophila TaxID=212818 RepID=A0A438N9I3_EXOME|nr:hypothetical protein B0A52_03614 [Exophiala mesophila]